MIPHDRDPRDTLVSSYFLAVKRSESITGSVGEIGEFIRSSERGILEASGRLRDAALKPKDASDPGSFKVRKGQVGATAKRSARMTSRSLRAR